MPFPYFSVILLRALCHARNVLDQRIKMQIIWSCDIMVRINYRATAWPMITIKWPVRYETCFPLGLENRESLGKCESIFQSMKIQGILIRPKKSGKFTQNTGKIRKFYIGKLEKIREICQPRNSKNRRNMVPYFKWKNKLLSNTWKIEKILEKTGKFFSPKKWEPWRKCWRFYGFLTFPMYYSEWSSAFMSS